MAKRLTDSEKWEDPWFLDLLNEYKMLWVYVLDKCDYAGIWKVNKPLAEYCFKRPVDLEGFLEAAAGRIMVFDSGRKWFIPKFLVFQYGHYSEGNKMYPKIEAYLRKEGINMEHLSPIDGVKEQDMVKDMETVKEGISKGRFQPPTLEDCEAAFAEKGFPPAEAGKFFHHYEARGWMMGKNKMKKWRSAIAGWIARDWNKPQKSGDKLLKTMREIEEDLNDGPRDVREGLGTSETSLSKTRNK